MTGGSEDDTFLLAEGLQVSVASRHAWLPDKGILYFVAADADHGFEVWRSDGTALGTYRTTDIAPGPASSDPRDLIAFQGKAFFAANDGTRGQALWTTDGTAAGTRMIRDPWPVPGAIVFPAWDPQRGLELWRSDGTRAGTRLVADVNQVDEGGS